ncbi:hypothetical protein B0H19DRAFT_1270951 [Mycena capillaripes]|nr:hypothetical protein B0H19DRAFT_1270951 [Mycena capillaripes]
MKSSGIVRRNERLARNDETLSTVVYDPIFSDGTSAPAVARTLALSALTGAFHSTRAQKAPGAITCTSTSRTWRERRICAEALLRSVREQDGVVHAEPHGTPESMRYESPWSGGGEALHAWRLAAHTTVPSLYTPCPPAPTVTAKIYSTSLLTPHHPPLPAYVRHVTARTFCIRHVPPTPLALP